MFTIALSSARRQGFLRTHLLTRYCSYAPPKFSKKHSKMGKNNKKRPPVPDEVHLLLPTHSELALSSKPAPIIDTHTHLLSTFSEYRRKYSEGKHESVYEFVREVYKNRNVDAIVDVYCEAPVQKAWKELADSALTEESRRDLWSGIDYWFVMGA